MKLIVIRHGETQANIKGIINGTVDGELSQEGIKQTQKLAKRLANEHIDKIYSSPLQRSVLTAQEVAKFHEGVEVEKVEELKEVDLGDFEGKLRKNVDWKERPTNAEPMQHAYDRIKNFTEKVFSENKDKTIVFVAHSGINKYLFKFILGTSPEKHTYIEQSNTAVNIFELKEDGNHRIKLANCIKHLD